ncbi:MAG TPA: hypothetical protein VIM16_01060 [Mucilaginibacter sp.]|jgi:hypothetical protein
MTTKQISEQIAAIRDATAKAMVSKQAAAAFLISAGIIREHDYSASAVDLNGTKIEVSAQTGIKSRKPHYKGSHQHSTAHLK